MATASSHRSWRNWIIGLAAGLVVLSASAFGFAPHLGRLFAEGFPAAQWPAAGDYAEIGGVAQPIALGSSDLVPNARAQQLFAESGGKALLVFHQGKLKLEHYAPDALPHTRFNSYSMAKSLVGTLVLKAHADGQLHSLDDPIGRYLPALGKEVGQRPVRSFLHMRSGLAFEEGSKTISSSFSTKDKEVIRYNPFGRLARLHIGGPEAVKNDLQVNAEEIGRFRYQNINTALLGELLATIYGQPIEQLLSEKVWRPAGAATAYWRRYNAGGPVSPYCCIYATARDWVRIGHFLAQNGTRDNPFLPPALWREFMGMDLADKLLTENHYGDHVYHNILDRPGETLQGRFTFMFGNGGQVVYMMPEKDLIIVRFGERVSLLHSTAYSAWRSIDPQ